VCYHAEFGCWVKPYREPQKSGYAIYSARSLWDRGRGRSLKKTPLCTCAIILYAHFGMSRSNSTSLRNLPEKKLGSSHPAFRVTQGHRNRRGSIGIYDLLFVVASSTVSEMRTMGTLKMRKWKMRNGQNCRGWKMHEWKYREGVCLKEYDT